MLKPLTVGHNKLWKILKEIGIQDHLICLLRNLIVYFTHMQSTSHKMTDESQIGIKIAGININNFRYADTTTIMAKSIEEINSLLKNFYSLFWSTQSKDLALSIKQK